MPSGAFRRTCFSLLALLTISGVNGNAFLQPLPHDQVEMERMSEVDIQTSLLAEVEVSLGSSAGSRVTEFGKALQSIFKSLPKNQHGGLGSATVRYALHRIFVQRHGWFISGLDRAGESWNGSSPTGILKDHVPAYVEEMFEKRLGDKGFGLHELSVLAATIEHLVHNEALSKLGTAYSIHEQLPTSKLDRTDANEVLETYMMMYILGNAMTRKTLAIVNRLKEKMNRIYLAWPETQVFILDVTKNVTGDAPELDFAMVAKIAEKMGELFGAFQAKECDALKTTLLKVEDRGSGRVRLSDFYKPAFGGEDGAWQFQESIPYLRQLGALDETVPEDPKVIVSNYLGSQANCIASSSFYGVCCMDECEELLTHLENEVKASEAPPARIAALISALPSATVTAPRELPATLRHRLDEIASAHGGGVPLHGRLFAQWMHHAYPRECQYPHVAGTTAPMAALAWKQESGMNHTASTAEIEIIVQEAELRKNTSSTGATEEEMPELMPWSYEEELLVVRTTPEWSSQGSGATSLRNLAFFAAVASIASGMVRSMKSGLDVGREENSAKFYV